YIRKQQQTNRLKFDKALAWAYNNGIRLRPSRELLLGQPHRAGGAISAAVLSRRTRPGEGLRSAIRGARRLAAALAVGVGRLRPTAAALAVLITGEVDMQHAEIFTFVGSIARLSVDYAPAKCGEKPRNRAEKRPSSNKMFLKALLLKLCLMAFALCVMSLLWSLIRGSPANRAFLRDRVMNLSVLVYGEEVYHMDTSPASVARRGELGSREEKPGVHQPQDNGAANDSPKQYDIPGILEEASRQVYENEAEVDLHRLGQWEANPEFGDMEKRAGAEFDWAALADRNHPNFTVWAVRYMDLLRPALARDPPSDLLTTVRPPDRRIKWNCMENRYMSGDRPSPVKIVDLLLFAYEFDVLEMRLYELDSLVDVFIIVETAKTLKKWNKPLLLGTVLNSPRFERFRRKIVYNVLDDSAQARYQRLMGEGEGTFGFEEFARAFLVEKYVEAFGEPDDSVLFIHGDLDEMPTAEQVAAFKYCTPKDPKLPVVLRARFVSQNFAWK
ncbi:Beta-1,4-mannosyl-glycoprotein 4-beta-N-acetylglucosaminyltransferase, partial [Perkinsus olseni]